MIFLLAFAFLAGLVTILAPCMWPMLPIVLSSTVKGTDHQRPLGIVLGIMASFAIFTLFVSSLVRIFHIDPNLFRLLAVVIIIFLGLSLVIPALSRVLELYVSRLTGKLKIQNQKGNDFQAGFLTGLTLGIIWSPCGGPILASIAALAATGMVNLSVILMTLAYVLGVGLPLFAFTYAGQHFLTKTKFISAYTGRVQQIFGVIMILTALAIYFNYDKFLQVKFLNAFPGLGQSLNRFESSDVVEQQLDVLKGKTPNTNTPAPDFLGIEKWLNVDKPLSIKDLKGKVVLVDFWTYTCINCLRTLPFTTSWYEKYKDQGFLVIGVHTPEFQFEKETKNVQKALETYQINYPVAQDNHYETWNNYHNQSWPAEYLIDVNGKIRRIHFGEGEYDQMEKAIQVLLLEAGQKIASPLEKIKEQTPQEAISPETYLGSKRNPDHENFSYEGDWTITDEYIVSGSKAVLNYDFTAGKVFIILRPPSGQVGKVKVYLDGKIIDSFLSGADVKDGVVTVDVDRLYHLVDLHGQTENHLLKLEFPTPGIEVFTFTFG